MSTVIGSPAWYLMYIIKPHLNMSDMDYVVSDPSTRQSVTWADCAKTAAWIEVLLGVESFGDTRDIVLDGGSHPLTELEVVQYYLH